MSRRLLESLRKLKDLAEDVCAAGSPCQAEGSLGKNCNALKGVLQHWIQIGEKNPGDLCIDKVHTSISSVFETIASERAPKKRTLLVTKKNKKRKLSPMKLMIYSPSATPSSYTTTDDDSNENATRPSTPSTPQPASSVKTTTTNSLQKHTPQRHKIEYQAGKDEEEADDVDDEKHDEPDAFSLTLEILVTAYSAWVEELIKGRIAQNSFGDDAKPQKPSEEGFESIVGAEREKQRIQEALIFPFDYPKLFRERARGVLMYGPPGTGKTMLLRAITRQVQNAVIYMPSASAFKSRWEGETEAKIHGMYDAVSTYLDVPNRPKFAIIGIDESDLLFGGDRSQDASKQRIINTFLQELDGINTDKRITTVAITNFPQTIDAAILRRLPVRIRVDLPTYEARRAFAYREIVHRYDITGDLDVFACFRKFGRSGRILSVATLIPLSDMTGPNLSALKASGVKNSEQLTMHAQTLRYVYETQVKAQLMKRLRLKDSALEANLLNPDWRKQNLTMNEQFHLDMVMQKPKPSFGSHFISALNHTNENNNNNQHIDMLTTSYPLSEFDGYDMDPFNAPRSGIHPMGCSLADIRIALVQAFNTAAARSLSKGAFYRRVPGVELPRRTHEHNSNDKKIEKRPLTTSTTTTTSTNTTKSSNNRVGTFVWVYDPSQKSPAPDTHRSVEELGRETDSDIDQRRDMLTFDLRWSDVKLALDELNVSVQVDKYAEMLAWEKGE